MVPERWGGYEMESGQGGTQGDGDRTGHSPEPWYEGALPPLLHLPQSPSAEAMCHHIFSSSAKLCLREAKDKSPEVCMFDSHLKQQLSAATGKHFCVDSGSGSRGNLQLLHFMLVWLLRPWKKRE